MPTICEIKMQLKELGVKGLTGKNKAELMFMLYNAKNPVPKVLPKKRQKTPAPEPLPEPLPVPVRKRPVMRVSPKDRLWNEITSLVEEAKSKAREGISAKELTEFYNKEISPKLDLYGAEYLDYGGAKEISDELFGDISEEYRKYNKEKEEQPNRKPSPPPIIPKLIKKQMLDLLAQDYDTHTYKRGMGHPIDDMIKWFKKVQSNEKYWGNYQTEKAKLAYNFIGDLIQWVGKNAYEAQEFPFGDHERTELILLNDDWNAFFKANR